MIAWQALLGGELLERAQEALAEITESLSAGAPPAVRNDWPPEIIRTSAFCLADGIAGQALYFGYLHQAGGGKRYGDVGLKLLDQAIEGASSEHMGPSLYGGFTGITWTANHLAGRLYPEDGEDPYLEADEVLYASIQRNPCPFHFDLISGLVGFGVYALERFPRESGRRCLEAIADRLAESSEEDSVGTTWLTPPDYLDEQQRAKNPRGSYCVGAAHGVPGVVALLAELWAADVARAKVGPLLEGAVSWVLAQAMPSGSLWRFPSWRDLENKPSPSRLAWCYGDPGVAASLLWAAQAMGRTDWRDEALKTARVAARRPLDGASVNDACLCHGSSGLAHIFNRLYQASGEEEMAQAALFWFEKLLDDRTPGQGCGGYIFEHRGYETVTMSPDPGFLSGTSGVGLALLAATTEIEPDWDRVLLTNVPPRVD